MKKFQYLLFTIVCSSFAYSEYPIVIKGVLKNTPPQQVKLILLTSDNHIAVDSAYIDSTNNSYVLKGMVEHDANIVLEFSRRHPNNFYFFCISPNDTLTIADEVNAPFASVFSVKGSPCAIERSERMIKIKKIAIHRGIMKERMYFTTIDSLKFQELQDSIKYLTHQIDSCKKSQLYSKFAPEVHFGLIGINNNDSLIKQSTIALQRFPEYPQIRGILGSAIKKKYNDSSIKLKPNIPTVALRDVLSFATEGATPSNLENSYVIYDFWASWCKPCLKDMPFIKQAVKRSNEKLRVISISIDKDSTAWRKAIEREKLGEFINMRIPASKQQDASKTFDLTMIPRNLITDPYGNVIGENLHQYELLEFVDKLFKSPTRP